MLSRGMALLSAAALRAGVFLGFMAGAQAASGQAGVWTTHGPVGGSVYVLVADPSHPSTLYAGTAQGVFKSGDAGASWRAASAGLPAVRVQTLAIDPTATSTLYAGTLTPNGVASVGIFKSTDGAASWTAINAGLTDPLTGISPLDVEALAIDPRNPGTLLAGTRFSEIFKSTDGGTSWQAQTLGGFNVALETSDLLFDPSDSSKVYAASTVGLLRSTDGGESWSAYGNAGVPFFRLVVDPTSPATLYACNLVGDGIFKSTDGGAHWSSANKGLPVDAGPSSPRVLALAIDPSSPATLYAGTYGDGLFQSSDGAATWAPAVSGMRDAYVASLTLPTGPPSTIYAGTLGGGIYQSPDGARTWTLSSAGLDLSLVSALVADPSGPLYAAVFDGVQKSPDGGASWQPVNNGLPVDPVAALALAPGNPQTVFAGTLGGGLFKSADGGATWSPSAQGLADAFISSIAVDPSSPSTLYAGTAHPDTTQSERVYKSTDGGGNWAQTTLDAKSSFIDSLGVNPARPSQLIAVSSGATGYFQSLDAGQTWSHVASDASCGGVNEILFEPSGATMYIAGTAGVCRSTDGGKTWALAALAAEASAQVLLIDPSSPLTVYAGAAPAVLGGTGGVFRSTDGGQTWENVGSGLASASVTSLALDARGKLHAGTHGGGVVELLLPPDRSLVQLPAPSSHGVKRLEPR